MAKIEAILKELKDIKNSMNLLNQNFETMKQDYEIIKKENIEILKKNKFLQDKVSLLEKQVNNLDLYGRRQNLEIQGIPYIPNENIKKIAVNVLQKVKDNIKMEDLDLVHRLGKETKDKRNFKENRSIIVRFKTRETRNSIFENRKKTYKFTVKDLGFNSSHHFYINENLNPQTKSLFFEANKLKKEHQWKYIWTKNGTIFTKKDDNTQTFIIRTGKDLQNIK